MKRIFVSYSRSDQATVLWLVSVLERLGHEVWLDRELWGSVDWWESIHEHLRSSDVVIAVVSRNFLSSTVCALELDYAVALRRVLIPFLIESNAVAKRLPPTLSSIHGIEYSGSSRDETVVQLVRTLEQVELVPLPNPLPPVPELPAAYISTKKDQPLLEQEQTSWRTYGFYIGGHLAISAVFLVPTAMVLFVVSMLIWPAIVSPAPGSSNSMSTQTVLTMVLAYTLILWAFVRKAIHLVVKSSLASVRRKRLRRTLSR